MFLSEDEKFLLLFRRESPLDSSVEFMQVSAQRGGRRAGEAGIPAARSAGAALPPYCPHGIGPGEEVLVGGPGCLP